MNNLSFQSSLPNILRKKSFLFSCEKIPTFRISLPLLLNQKSGRPANEKLHLIEHSVAQKHQLMPAEAVVERKYQNKRLKFTIRFLGLLENRHQGHRREIAEGNLESADPNTPLKRNLHKPVNTVDVKPNKQKLPAVHMCLPT